LIESSFYPIVSVPPVDNEKLEREDSMAREEILLGHVTTSTGSLVVADFGLLGAFDSEADTATVAKSRADGDTLAFTFVGNTNIQAIACHKVPLDTPIAVTACRVESGKFSDRWAHVDVQVRPDATVAQTEVIGKVLVDFARLAVGDVVSMCGFGGPGTADGLADVVWWGRDAEHVANHAHVPRLSDAEFGYTDLPDEAAEAWVQWLERCKTESSLRFAWDYRPHNYQWQMLGQVRDSATQSGTVDINKNAMVGFMTTWGDDVYDVVAMRDAEGQIARIRIQLTFEVDRSVQLEQAAEAAAVVASGAAGDTDPELFPGQPVARLSDYVRIMKAMQTGQGQAVLAEMGLDMTGYAQVAQEWGARMAVDPTLTAKFSAMFSTP
jgi:hypothetical protein